MKKIIFSVLLALLIVSAGVAAVSYSVKDFLSNIQINTTQMPVKGWVRWQTVIATERGCNWVDFTRLSETPKVGWKAAWDFIQQDLIPTFGNPPLTEAEKVFCYGDWPAVSFIVQKNGTYTTRPLYDGDLWLASRDTTSQWKQIGRVEVGAICEQDTIRKTSYEYHFVKNAAGTRGLTACVLKP